MIYLDLALRSSAITLILLLAALLWRAPIGLEGRLSVLALAITKSAFLAMTAALPLNLDSVLHANLALLSSLTPASVTWLIVTIFLDAPGRRWPWILASLVTSAALFADVALPISVSICLPMAVGLYGALFTLSLWSTRDDLVECRCRARPGFAAAIAGVALILTMGQLTGVLEEGSILLAILQATGTLIVTLSFAIWLLNPDASRWPGETITPTSAPPSDADTFSDPALITRIETTMAAGIWREEGLTIGALAGKLAVPEHRLRRAINQGLGYRNFSSFINRARIEAACNMLTDPERINVTILEIAYDVGFSSVGPFNRAFRAEMGQSPTAFRRTSQTRALADSDKSAPIPANFH